MENIRIGLVQMQSRLGDSNANLLKIGSFVADAKKQGVDIICFPVFEGQ